jgi:hypothetical protein
MPFAKPWQVHHAGRTSKGLAKFPTFWRRRRRIYYTGAVPQLEQPVYYEDLGNSL